MYSKKKMSYQKPNMNIIVLNTNDIITMSNGFNGDWDNTQNNNGQ